MNKSKILVSTVMAGLLTFANVAHTSPEGGKGGHAKHGQVTDAEKAERMEERLNHMATKLGLTDEQKAQVLALKQNSINEVLPLREEQRKIRTEIRELDVNASDYVAKLTDAANRKSEISRQMTIIKGTQRQKMASILTAEQLATQEEMKSKKKSGKRKGNK